MPIQQGALPYQQAALPVEQQQGSMPIKGSMPTKGEAPYQQGSMPVKGALPQEQGSMPVKGSMPIKGSMPTKGSLPVKGAIKGQAGQGSIGQGELGQGQLGQASNAYAGQGIKEPSVEYRNIPSSASVAKDRTLRETNTTREITGRSGSRTFPSRSSTERVDTMEDMEYDNDADVDAQQFFGGLGYDPQ